MPTRQPSIAHTLIKLAHDLALSDHLGDMYEALQEAWDRHGLGRFPTDSRGDIDWEKLERMLDEVPAADVESASPSY